MLDSGRKKLPSASVAAKCELNIHLGVLRIIEWSVKDGKMVCSGLRLERVSDPFSSRGYNFHDES